MRLWPGARARPAAGDGQRRAGHRDLRAELPGLVRVPDGDAPRPGGTLRGHHRVDGRDPAVGRVGARPAGPRRQGGRRGEQDDPGADPAGPRHLRRRDTAARRPGPKANKKYLQVACTSLLTYYFLGERSLPSFKGFIYSDLYGTVVVHDRYVNYDHFGGISHQLCTAHLLRDIEDAAQTYPEAIWPAQIARELRALIHAANVARGQGLAAVPDELTAEHLKLFRNGVNAGLSQVRRVPGGSNVKQPPALHLLECLKHREADVLRFLTDTAIPPTSNQAERDLRPSKTQQKISGRLRSETTTRHRYAIRGYASTARKHGIDVFTAIKDALAGNPWIPPVPAITGTAPGTHHA